MKTRGANEPAVPAPAPEEALWKVFCVLLGVLFGVTLLKFGNPVIMESFATPPADVMEWLINSWPMAWGQWLLVGVAAVGVGAGRWRKDLPRWLVWLPLAWLVWQLPAVAGSVNPDLSLATVVHFGTCVICFYLGLCVLGRSRNPWRFWLGVLAGFSLVLFDGFEQHQGGLEATRKWFFENVYPTNPHVPAEYFKRLNSTRIFATLFYPNTLAGVILLWLPILVAVIWSWKQQFTAGARGLLVAMLTAPALACLYWSGSKGGWLLLLVTGFVGVLFLPFRRQAKLLLVAAVLVVGLGGFAWRYTAYFKKGATSVVARFDYWEAAVKIAAAHPVLGTGPGAFGKSYLQIKRPESEAARMTHNDYLEQASDSGVAGAVLFTGFVVGTLVLTFRRAGLKEDRVRLAVWLGLLGWSLHSAVEFNLYIPAQGWPAFCLLGWLLAQTPKPIDTKPAAG